MFGSQDPTNISESRANFDMEARNRANSSDSFVLVEVEEESTAAIGDGALSRRPTKKESLFVPSSFIHQNDADDDLLPDSTPVLRRRRPIKADGVAVGGVVSLHDSRPLKIPRSNATVEAIMMATASSPQSKRRAIFNPYREPPKDNTLWPSTRLLCLLAIVLTLLNHYEASWMPLVCSGRSVNATELGTYDTAPKRSAPERNTQQNFMRQVPLKQLEAFLSQHEQVLLVGCSPLSKREAERWELFARNVRDMSHLPLSVVVAKVDCTERERFATSRFHRPRSVSWYRNGKEIDSYNGGIDPETPLEFLRGMLALSPDSPTRKAVARLPTGYVGMSSITRDWLKTIVQQHKKETERKRKNSPNGTIFFGDDGDDWAMKAKHGDTRLAVYDRWRNSGTRYLVDETAFASFLDQNKEQAFILFCTFNTVNCGSDRNWDTMRKEKAKQLVSELPFAEVPCGLAPRLCLEQNITVYPTLRSYVNSVAEESELTETPMGAEEIVQWASRHSKLDRVPLLFNDSEVAVVSPSNYTAFAEENQYVFLYVYEEGHTSSTIERELYRFSKQVGPLPLVVAKMAVPPSLLVQAPDRWGPSATAGTTWSIIVGPHGRGLYFHSNKDMKRYSGRSHGEVSFIGFLNSCDPEALESPLDKQRRVAREQEAKRMQEEEARLAQEREKRNAQVKEEKQKKSHRDALKRALLLFDEQLPEESKRIHREDTEPQIHEADALGEADKYPGFVEDATNSNVLEDVDTMGSDEVEVMDLD